MYLFKQLTFGQYVFVHNKNTGPGTCTLNYCPQTCRTCTYYKNICLLFALSAPVSMAVLGFNTHSILYRCYTCSNIRYPIHYHDTVISLTNFAENSLPSPYLWVFLLVCIPCVNMAEAIGSPYRALYALQLIIIVTLFFSLISRTGCLSTL